MFHKGTRGDGLTDSLDSTVAQKINNMLDQFIDIVKTQLKKKEVIRWAMVRSMLPCSIFIRPLAKVI